MSERWKLDKYSFVDTRDNSCLNFGLKDISRVVLQLNNYEDLLDNYEQQLAEKDEEIEEYKTQIKEFCGTKLAKLIDKKEREVRHQVCEEIRERTEDLIEASFDNEEDEFSTITIWGLKKVLDQIEKGE